MSCTGSLSLRYNIGLKCKLPKILLTTKMIQHSKSVQTKTRRNAISNKKKSMPSISRTLSGVISHVGLFLLASCGTLGSCSRNPRVSRNPGWKSLLQAVAVQAEMCLVCCAGATRGARMHADEAVGLSVSSYKQRPSQAALYCVATSLWNSLSSPRHLRQTSLH